MKKIIKILNIIQFSVFLLLVIIGMSVVINPDYFVQKFAIYLVIEANPQKADAIVVISGNDNSKRLNEGIRLYEEGYADELILSGYKDVKGIEYLFTKTDIDLYSLHYDQASSTYENAEFVKEYMLEKGYNSLIIVSSPPQSRRALMTFKYVMPEYELSISYSKKHVYDPDLIFEDKEIRENFNNEGMKYIYYFLKYGI